MVLFSAGEASFLNYHSHVLLFLRWPDGSLVGAVGWRNPRSVFDRDQQQLRLSHMDGLNENSAADGSY